MRLPAMTQLPQQWRLAAAGFYFAGFLLAGYYLTGVVPPPATTAGLWFWAATVALITSSFLTEPFYSRPVDSIAVAIALAIGALTLNPSGAAIPISDLATGSRVALAIAIAIVAVAVVAIALKDSDGRAADVASAATVSLRTLGRAQFVFTIAYVAAAYAAFADDGWKLAIAISAWMTVFWARPFERAVVIALRIGRARQRGARVIGLEDPMVLHLQLPQQFALSVGDVVAVGSDAAEGIVVDTSRILTRQEVRISFAGDLAVSEGQTVSIATTEQPRRAIGYVAEGTSLGSLHVRVAPLAQDLGLTAASLLEVGRGDESHLYLVTDAQATRRDDGSATRTTVMVTAREIGRWNESDGMFAMRPWPPRAGEPVYLANVASNPQFNDDWIGTVPGTSFGAAAQISDLVTHNAAILGVLGIGKTSLAVQLIRRMIVAGVKVVVLDVTRRYAVEFRDIYSGEWEAIVSKKVADLVANDAASAPTKLVTAFLAGRSRLLIANPADFLSSTRATLAQVTKDFAEALLLLAQEEHAQADPDQAKYCLVLEEAHSLVPETGSVIDRSEINFVNGTARAVLQGRKYGLGSLLVTQRSANVAKSILNQCNTMFGMRMYDDTGINFLSNYIGSGYAGLLPTLAPQRVIAFGRGVRCAAPVVLDIYDSKLFRDNFWAPRVSGVPLPGEGPAPTGEGGTSDKDEMSAGPEISDEAAELTDPS